MHLYVIINRYINIYVVYARNNIVNFIVYHKHNVDI